MNSNLQSTVEINNAVRTIVMSAVNTIPYLGWILSPLVSFLWPTGKQAVWDQIVQNAENQLQSVLNQDFDEYTLDTAQTVVEGLNKSLQTYLTAVKTPGLSTSVMQAYYIVATNTLVTALPQLQLSGFQTLLLPLYAQAVNLGVALYRDGATPATGALLGFNATDIGLQATDLTNLVASATAYVKQYVPAGSTQAYNHAQGPLANSTGNWPPAPGNYSANTVWNAVNQYNRYMTLAVNDYAFMWNYLQDPAPTGPMPPNTREIYSDACGCLYSYPPGTAYTHSPNGPLQSASGKPMISAIRLFGNGNVDAVQQAYAGVWGPRLGDQPSGSLGGSDSPPPGWNGTISPTNPITGVSVGWEGWLWQMQLQFQDGSLSGMCGVGTYGGNPSLTLWTFEDEVVSQIYIETDAQGAYAPFVANAAIIGFRLADSYPPPASSTT